MLNYLKDIYAQVKSLYAAEPVRLTAFAAAAIVFGFAHAGVVVPTQDVLTALAYVIPIIGFGEIVRPKVTPVSKLTLAGRSRKR
jgi:hypothetical protein